MNSHAWLLALVCAVAVCAQTPVAATPLTGKNALAATSAEIRALTRQASRAVVEVEVTGYKTNQQEGSVALGSVSRQQGLGSGVIVGADGYIVTNAHVVEGAVDVKVLLPEVGQKDEEDVELRRLQATIVGVDHESDLALIKVNAANLPVLTFASIEKLRQGDLVLAIGNPMGLRNSVSLGVVSATARSVRVTSPFGYIQTDASINPGNSGGALVDAEGRLVGINTFILSQSGGNEGLGFAIPINIVQDVVQQLREKGHADRGEIGVLLEDITPPLSSALALPRAHGVILADVVSQSPAEAAGLKMGDILLTVNGVSVANAARFRSFAYAQQPGEKLQISYLRGEQQLQTAITMRKRHASFDPMAALTAPDQHLVRRLGILGLDVDKDLVALLPTLRQESGVLVARRTTEGAAQPIDLETGDVIHSINGEPVLTLDFLRGKIESLKSGAAVALQVEREGRMLYSAFEVE